MDLSNKLNISHTIKHELGINLTPEMRMRLSILQATLPELTDILNKEISENPLLDGFDEEDEDPTLKGEVTDKEESTDDDEVSAKSETTDNSDLADSDSEYNAKEEIREKKDETEDLKMSENDPHLDEFDSGQYENNFENENYIKNPTPDYNPEMGKFDEYKYNSMTHEEEDTLAYELITQLNALHLSDELYLSVNLLILNLNKNGFLETPLTEIAEVNSFSVEVLAKGLEILRLFEPSGVGASNVEESLLIQLQQKGLKDSLAYQIIEKHFDLFTRRNFEKLAQIFKVKEVDIKNAGETIKELNPSPISNFSDVASEYVVPDVIVTEENGKYTINVPSNFPIMRVNKKLIKQYKENKQTSDFIKTYEARIKEIMRGLEERTKTIEKIIKKIITIQDGYLHSEEAGLKPLTYKEIALDAGVSESTVSRVVSKKYIQLPTGVFPLKKFFTTGVETSNGGGLMSNAVIKAKIKDIINSEDSKNPINDTDIEKILKEQGIPVARRTVTKYREQLAFLPANLRKK
ncbi:MAG: RNA polymerase factor sigma-54 [bacterium]